MTLIPGPERSGDLMQVTELGVGPLAAAPLSFVRDEQPWDRTGARPPEWDLPTGVSLVKLAS